MIPAFLALAMVATASPPPIEGVWHNPKNSVAVKTGACGDKLCGWVVRANQEALDDARDGGTPNLIGTALLRDYHSNGRYSWSGTIFVPDMGRSFGSTIKMIDRNTISLKGCLIGGFFCKTQVWHRD